MRFAKVNDGALEFAPRILETENGKIITNSPEIYAELGYKPIVVTEAPDNVEGYDNVYHWEETEEACLQMWEQVEIPKPEAGDSSEYEEYYNAMSSALSEIE